MNTPAGQLSLWWLKVKGHEQSVLEVTTHGLGRGQAADGPAGSRRAGIRSSAATYLCWLDGLSVRQLPSGTVGARGLRPVRGPTGSQLAAHSATAAPSAPAVRKLGGGRRGNRVR